MNWSVTLLMMSFRTPFLKIPTLVFQFEVYKACVVSTAAVRKGLFGVQCGNKTRAGVGACGVPHNVSPPFPCGIRIVWQSRHPLIE